jgi:hypothetical protein
MKTFSEADILRWPSRHSWFRQMRDRLTEHSYYGEGEGEALVLCRPRYDLIAVNWRL